MSNVFAYDVCTNCNDRHFLVNTLQLWTVRVSILINIVRLFHLQGFPTEMKVEYKYKKINFTFENASHYINAREVSRFMTSGIYRSKNKFLNTPHICIKMNSCNHNITCISRYHSQKEMFFTSLLYTGTYYTGTAELTNFTYPNLEWEKQRSYSALLLESLCTGYVA